MAIMLRVDGSADRMVVTAAGEMDLDSIEAVTALAVHPLNGSRRIVIDMAAVTFLDSGGVYALVTLHGLLLGLELRNPMPDVATVLRVVGLDIWVVDD